MLRFCFERGGNQFEGYQNISFPDIVHLQLDPT